MTPMNRRAFLMAAAAATWLPTVASANAFQNKLCFFSKHLPELDWQQLGKTVKQLGFDGVDLTVRPGGHVLPERAAEDLPKAVAALRDAGLAVPMITTGLLTAAEPTAQPIIATAGKLGIGYFKTGYHKYKFADPRAELQQAGQAFRSLAELGKRHNLQAGFHNHASYIGGGLWDFLPQMDLVDAQAGGWYFDARHAVAEGGAGAWKAALQTIAPRLKMSAVKDFTWIKTAKGWAPQDCPLGQGMVDWDAVFAIFAKSGFSGPISLHIEYDIAGKTLQEKQANTLAAAARDFAFLKARLQAAYVKS
jgi:sugar phosphate isomerase/epimerase